MADVTTDLVVGSYRNLPEQTITVTTAGPVAEDVDVATGNYYLWDNNSDWDLTDKLETALNLHSAIAGATVFLRKDLKTRIDLNGTTASITWPADGLLSTILGFTQGNLSGANAYTSDDVSPLLFSAGKTLNQEARFGTDGIPVHDTVVGQAGTGTKRALSHNEYRRNRFFARYVQNDRVWPATEAYGTYFQFWEWVLRRLGQLKVWTEVTENISAGSAALTFGSVLPASTSSRPAYVYAGAMDFPYAREFGLVESLSPIDIPVHTVPEYAAQ